MLCAELMGLGALNKGDKGGQRAASNSNVESLCGAAALHATAAALFDTFDFISGALKWVKPAVHACRSETALGCTMREAGRESFTCCT
jgi:hypothetical protein